MIKLESTRNLIQGRVFDPVKLWGADENIGPDGVKRGSYQYVGPDGVTYVVGYFIDENGYKVSAQHAAA